jgi:hypothetical protein
MDLMDIWSSTELSFFRGGWTPDDIKVCRDCSEWQVCDLAFLCRAVPHSVYGDMLGPSPECVMRMEDEVIPSGITLRDQDVLDAYRVDSAVVHTTPAN